MWMAQKREENHIHRKKVSNENDLPQEIASQILSLHELGILPAAIRINLSEICHAKVSLRLINRTVNKMDYLIEEWLNRLKRSIG
jgi:hypothetical protein